MSSSHGSKFIEHLDVESTHRISFASLSGKQVVGFERIDGLLPVPLTLSTRLGRVRMEARAHPPEKDIAPRSIHPSHKYDKHASSFTSFDSAPIHTFSQSKLYSHSQRTYPRILVQSPTPSSLACQIIDDEDVRSRGTKGDEAFILYRSPSIPLLRPCFCHRCRGEPTIPIIWVGGIEPVCSNQVKKPKKKKKKESVMGGWCVPLPLPRILERLLARIDLRRRSI